MYTFATCSLMLASTVLVAGQTQAEPWVIDLGDALQDPAGCLVVDETFNDEFEPDWRSGWTLGNSGAICSAWATPIVIESESQGCEVLVHVAHSAGPNEYSLSLHEDLEGEVGDILALQTYIDQAGRLGGPFDPLVFDISKVCLAPGTYWIAARAIGDETLGSVVMARIPETRPLRFDRDCDEDYEELREFAQPGSYRVTAIEGCGVGGGLEIFTEGSCPGRITIHADGGTPGGRIAFAYSFRAGAWTVPGGPCAGTELGIIAPTVAGFVNADGSGHAQLSGNVPDAGCGRVHIQCVDVSTCTPSNIVSL